MFSSRAGEWQDYVGKQALADCGFGERDFARLRRTSSWATGSRKAAAADAAKLGGELDRLLKSGQCHTCFVIRAWLLSF